LIGEGEHRYAFEGEWGRDEHHHSGHSVGWAHHGIAINGEEVITFHEEKPEVLFLGLDGSFLRSWPVNLTEGHGFALVRENGRELLWIADNGSKFHREDDGEYVATGPPVHGSYRRVPRPPARGAAVKFDLDGNELLRLTTPPLPIYEDGDYSPTQVAVDEERFGGTGDIWVADGYGQSLVHRYSRGGKYLATITGEEGAGRFWFPHSVYIDRRAPQPELYVADRKNKRIQVYDLQGTFLRSFGEDFLVSPGGFAPYGEDLLIAELDARLTVVDGQNRFVCYLGEYDESARLEPGWPNVMVEGKPQRPLVVDGEFRTPHGMAVDADGNVYVSEWFIGGRLVRLEQAKGVKPTMPAKKPKV
jgi:hypothetical protein